MEAKPAVTPTRKIGALLATVLMVIAVWKLIDYRSRPPLPPAPPQPMVARP